MGILLLAVFIGVPILEIAIFIEVGGFLGLWPTLGLVVLTAILGTWQLRAQGLATLMRARSQVERGELPAHELFDGACLLLAGALLLTPGFITDTAGFLLFLAPFREYLRRLLARHIKAHAQTRIIIDGKEVRQDSGPIIDGDFSDETKRDERPEDGPPRPPRLPR
jgi:UPF0716 protein FxsA